MTPEAPLPQSGRATTTRTVVACDRDGRPLHTVGAMEAHESPGILHKAFSVLIFRKGGSELLLQQRSRHKPLFPLRWSNTCCSHPAQPDTVLVDAAQRRLRQELGIRTPLREVGSFVYRAEDRERGRCEHEHDVVLIGHGDGIDEPRPDPREIADWRWQAITALQGDLQDNPLHYSPWLPAALRVALTGIDALQSGT